MVIVEIINDYSQGSIRDSILIDGISNQSSFYYSNPHY